MRGRGRGGGSRTCARGWWVAGGSRPGGGGVVPAPPALFLGGRPGRPRSRGEPAAALMYQHRAEPVPVEAVPGPLRPLVAAGMAKQPADRPADAAAFVAALSQ